MKKDRERKILVKKTEHALAQWSTRPCKPKAQQTVRGLHQHPGEEGGDWIKHVWIRNTLLRGQPGEHEQSRNSTIQLYLCVRICLSVCVCTCVSDFLLKAIVWQNSLELLVI